MSPYIEETALHGAIKFCDPNDPACVRTGRATGERRVPVRQFVVASLRCPSDEKNGLVDPRDRVVTWAGLARPGSVAVTNYAGLDRLADHGIVDRIQVGTVVGNGGAQVRLE